MLPLHISKIYKVSGVLCAKDSEEQRDVFVYVTAPPNPDGNQYGFVGTGPLDFNKTGTLAVLLGKIDSDRVFHGDDVYAFYTAGRGDHMCRLDVPVDYFDDKRLAIVVGRDLKAKGFGFKRCTRPKRVPGKPSAGTEIVYGDDADMHVIRTRPGIGITDEEAKKPKKRNVFVRLKNCVLNRSNIFVDGEGDVDIDAEDSVFHRTDIGNQ